MVGLNRKIDVYAIKWSLLYLEVRLVEQCGVVGSNRGGWGGPEDPLGASPLPGSRKALK